jgi:hypothetical protein
MQTQLFPFNTAEAVLDPFWDPLISTLPQWASRAASGCAVTVEQNWCNVVIQWERCTPSGAVLTMTRAADCDISDYDTFLFSYVFEAGHRIRVSATGKSGLRCSTEVISDGDRHELALPVDGISVLREVRVEFLSSGGSGSGWIIWTGLQHAGRLAEYRQYYRELARTIPNYVTSPENPAYEPHLGVVLSAQELHDLRAHAASVQPPTLTVEPAQLVSDFILSGPDTRYGREREHGLNLLRLARQCAIYGAVSMNADYLRRAAEYAVAEVLTTHWDWAFISRMPGSSFEIRSFMQEQILDDLATVLDLAHDFLTESSRELFLRRMAQDGIGNINFISWKHEYIHHCNQLPAFSGGRIAAYGVLLRSWPRVAPYLDLAVEELIAALEQTVLEDGGFEEGPSYFHYTMVRGLFALHCYARATGADFSNVVPERVRASVALADALYSTCPEQIHIPICDAHVTADPDTLARLAYLMPDSVWTTMYQKSKERSSAPGFTALSLDSKIPGEGRLPSPFRYLPEMRLASSFRTYNEKPVRLIVLGNRAGAGHAHEDKGSFVLEYAGNTIAMDPGICSYSHPLTAVLKQAQRHNMLVPIGTDVRPHPANPLSSDIDIDCSGDEVSFSARVDCSTAWPGFFRMWLREIDSPEPGRITIIDEYELESGTGVAFLLQTVAPVRQDGSCVYIGEDSALARCIPDDRARIEVSESELPESGVPQRTVSFVADGVKGTLTTVIELL